MRTTGKATFKVWVNPQDGHWEKCLEYAPKQAEILTVTQAEYLNHTRAVNESIMMERFYSDF